MARPILTVAEMSAADQAAVAAGTPVSTLMERAGEAVAEAIKARWSPRSTVVLCGPGDNGGDGYVVARKLVEAGWPVRVLALAAKSKPKGAALAAAERWAGGVEALDPRALQGAELIVDALFGAGLSRPLDLALRDVLRAAEASGAPIVAVDLPSGLSGDLARPLGYAPRAKLTVTFHARKLAHALEPGRSLCGEIVVADIGLAAAPTPTFENAPELWAARLPWPVTETHKVERGRLLVVTGPVSATGAARLAARAGLRVGAGLVTLVSPPDAVLVNAAQATAVMVRAFGGDADLQAMADQADALVIGPGAGVTDATRLNLQAVARTGVALVVDADALTVFRDDPEELFAVLDRDDVLTPHLGEFERVFPRVMKTAPERLTAARRAAGEAGAIVVLKGPDTVIAAPDGRAAVNLNGSPWLATAGSGDVLAGLIAGLVAQGMESFDAACAGVWIHAEAARGFGPGLISEDLPELTPPVLRRLWDARQGT